MNQTIKILFLASNPIDTVRLQLTAEVREIDQALLKVSYRHRFELENHSAVRMSDLQELLLRYKPSIVHFSGHGSLQGEIIVQDDVGNRSPVPMRALSKLFSILKNNIRCVVLNACYSETQAQGIAEHIDCVIGMSNEIADKPAMHFSSAFYRAIGYGQDLKTAFDLGCLEIEFLVPGNEHIPILIGDKEKLAKTYLLTEISQTQLDKIHSCLELKQYKNVTQLCEEILESNSEHPDANLIIAISSLSGQTSDSHPRAKIRQIEDYLNKAAQFEATANVARIIMGLVKYDHYRYDKEGEPTIEDIKRLTEGVHFTESDNYYIGHINASPEAYAFFGISKPNMKHEI